LAHRRRDFAEAQSALENGRRLREEGRADEAVSALQRGKTLAQGWPGGGGLVRELDLESARAGRAVGAAQRARAVRELHDCADTLRVLYGTDAQPRGDLRKAEALCRAFWDKRGLILDLLGEEPDGEQRVRADLLDLAVLWTDLHVRLAAASDVIAARREALDVLAESEARFGPSQPLYRERQRHAQALGLAELAREAGRRAGGLEPSSAWEHYALARSLMMALEPLPAGGWTWGPDYLLRSVRHRLALARAASELERAVDLQPQGLWPNFYQGACAYRRARYEDAVNAFTACIAIKPEWAGGYYNRALAHTAVGRTERARRDFDRASQLDPGMRRP
jgi:tetratricopeptide (TPR) repeat protein